MTVYEINAIRDRCASKNDVLLERAFNVSRMVAIQLSFNLFEIKQSSVLGAALAAKEAFVHG